MAKRVFDFVAQWDPDAQVWWCSNDELPVTTEARTVDELMAHIRELAPEIARMNGLAAVGDGIDIHFTLDRVQSVPVAA